MTELITYLAAFAAGMLLGFAYFRGLWWTVHRLAQGDCPAWFYLLSSLLRVAVMFGGFWWVSAGGLGRLAACLLGWLVCRQLMISCYGKGGRTCT